MKKKTEHVSIFDCLQIVNDLHMISVVPGNKVHSIYITSRLVAISLICSRQMSHRDPPNDLVKESVVPL